MKKKIAFIATREPGYSRVAITREQLKRYYDVEEYVSSHKNYPLRLAVIAIRLIWSWLTGRLRKADAVFVGFLAQPIFPLVRILYRGPVISDAYFSLFDAMVNDKQKASSKSITGRVCYWLDRHMLEKSELCFTDTQQHVDYMQNFFGLPNADIRRLWISAENEPLNQTLALTNANVSGNNDPFEVFFWGGFIPLQGVETIVRAAARLRNDHVNFTIFGAGQTFEQCQQLKRQLNTDNLKFAGWQQSDQIAIQAAKSHLALGIFGTTDKAGRVIPNKVYEALAMGIPLITCRSPACDELLKENVHCMLVDPGNAGQLAQQILWARDHFDDARQMAIRGQQLFERTCSPDEIGQIMHTAIESLFDSTAKTGSTANLTNAAQATGPGVSDPVLNPIVGATSQSVQPTQNSV